MPITVYDPTHNGLSLRQLFARPDRSREPLAPFPVDVIEEKEVLLVRATLPGASRESLDVSYEKEFLTIKAEIALEPVEEGSRHLLQERSGGSFSRTFRLPFPVDADAAQADYKDGILSLRLPKVEAIKPKQIPIQ